MIGRAVVTSIFLATTMLAQQATPPAAMAPAATGLILGRVVDAETGTPISSVTVSLAPAPGTTVPPTVTALISAGRSPIRPVLTDAQGRFVFRNIPAGVYQVGAQIGGSGYSPSGFLVSGLGYWVGPYLSGGYGQRRPNGPLEPIELTDGGMIGDAVIKLWKGGTIEGAVFDETGEPLVAVSIAAARRSADGRLLTGPSTKTDDRGRYRLPSLPPGDYVVVVPQTQTLSPVSFAEATLAAPPDPSLTTRLFSAGVSSSIVSGVRVGDSLVASTASQVGYVMNSLVPVRSGDRVLAYQTTFHPSASSFARAAPIRLKPGETASGIDVRMMPVPAVSVSGTLGDANGPVGNFGVHLLPADLNDGAAVLEVAQTLTDAAGRFMFPLVPAGNYRLHAFRLPRGTMTNVAGVAPAPAPTRTAEMPGAAVLMPLAVGDQPINSLGLMLREPKQVAGRLEWNGAGARPTADRMRALLISAVATQPTYRSGITSPAASVMPTGEFAITDVPSGRYVIRVPEVLGAWQLQSIVAGGRDITDVAITIAEDDLGDVVITVTDQPAQLSGTVTNPSGASSVDATVYVFPTDRARWPDARASMRTFRATRTTRAGAFTITNMIPGEYFVTSVTDDSHYDWPDVAVLTKLAAGAQTVRLVAGQKAMLVLR